ncbi:MAG: undecaprenyl-diphosphate phosphatase [Pseudomonadota bacterium]|nr:undecaprenyl-diphosphate phosphatase [Pseudomonadota bacterium]
MTEPGLLQIVVLAVVQGLTEFLPISSSAHLILVPVILGWPDQGLLFDVAVHIGTLSAVLWYFRRDLAPLWIGWRASIATRTMNAEGRLAWAVLLGTVPVGLAGLLLGDWVEEYLRGPLVIAWATIGFGLLLWLADIANRGERSEHALRWQDVIVVGLAQALALVPGTSRSGITMTAALFAGLGREGAARFSFLLSIPVIALAGLFEAKDLVDAEVAVAPLKVLLAIALSAISAYLCIEAFMRLLQRLGMLPFVIYRLLLGAVLLVVFW